ncbi:MAG: hypothetical protein ACTSW4_06550 [Candidatus Ranarchaeia archaeon]
MTGLTIFDTVSDAILVGVLGLILVFAVTLGFIGRLRKMLMRKGKTGVDVHKPDKPVVPEMGGLGAIIGVETVVILIGFLFPAIRILVFVFGASIGIGGGIGILDDLYRLKAWQKPLLTALSSFPILFTGSYSSLILPIVGATRLTIVYPLIIPLAFAVCTNTTNMIDVFNGTMSGGFSIVFVVLMAASLVVGSQFGFIGAGILLGATLALYFFNRYPARVFCGDTGALTIGSGLAALSILGGIETVAVIAILPFIMNAFHSLASVGGLFERHEMKRRPITVVEGTLLSANIDPGAPLTLTRLLLSKGPLTEVQIIKDILYLTLISGGLALLTSMMFVADIFMVVFFIGIGCLFVLGCSLVLPVECKGPMFVICIVWVSAILGLWLIDTWIVELPDPPELVLRVLTQFLKIGFSSLMGIGWLFLWNRLVSFYFWKNMVIQVHKRTATSSPS